MRKAAESIDDGNGGQYLLCTLKPDDEIQFFHPRRKDQETGLKLLLKGKFVKTCGAKCLVYYSFDGIINELYVPLANMVIDG